MNKCDICKKKTKKKDMHIITWVYHGEGKEMKRICTACFDVMISIQSSMDIIFHGD